MAPQPAALTTIGASPSPNAATFCRASSRARATSPECACSAPQHTWPRVSSAWHAERRHQRAVASVVGAKAVLMMQPANTWTGSPWPTVWPFGHDEASAGTRGSMASMSSHAEQTQHARSGGPATGRRSAGTARSAAPSRRKCARSPNSQPNAKRAPPAAAAGALAARESVSRNATPMLSICDAGRADVGARFAQHAVVEMLDRVGRDVQVALDDRAHDRDPSARAFLFFVGDHVGRTRRQARRAANAAQHVVVFGEQRIAGHVPQSPGGKSNGYGGTSWPMSSWIRSWDSRRISAGLVCRPWCRSRRR